MKGLIASIMTTTFTLGLGAVIAQAQNWTGSAPLGDVARQLKAQRAKSAKKPRVFTNDDLVALQSSGDQSPPSAATSSSASSKPAKHPAPPREHALHGQVTQGAASAPTGEWAKAKFRAAPGVVSGASEPGPIATASISVQPSPRQDLGYVERANGRVEAIVAEGEHVGLVQETEAFVKNFHDSASSPAEVEVARASPEPINPPASPGPEADQVYPSSSAQDASSSPSAAGGVDVAVLRPSEPTPGDNDESQSEASATLQSEPLADYASDQFRARPPETLQAPACPVLPASAEEGVMNHSTVRPLGYVEKAGGEREAIVEVLGQVYLVHEGELFAEKYRALKVTPSSVEIVEELTEASSASPGRRWYFTGDRPPDSR